MGVVDVVPVWLFGRVSDVGIFIALMTDLTRDSIMEINPIAHTTAHMGNFFPEKGEKKCPTNFRVMVSVHRSLTNSTSSPFSLFPCWTHGPTGTLPIFSCLCVDVQ
jgi:hypothetical protein